MVGLISVVIVFSLSYTVALFVMSRRRRPYLGRPSEPLWFVFLVPCLNEELVISQSLDRLLALPNPNFAVLVIDDGSEDRTAEIVRSYDDPRVLLLQRVAPNARQGKGEALNAAFRHLRDSGVLADRASRDVIVAVLDADGRLDHNALFEVAPYFNDPQTGAVQIGVRMYNAGESVLARMQDFEFVTFTEIFQRARQQLGSVGLGGNGQFARLAALESLGDAPWTDCLTEDLDLGVRLLVGGWHNSYCPTTKVEQQAVTSARRLVRQRSRWFQGHLQCWKRIPLVLRSSLPARAALDLLQHLLSPALVLAMTVPILTFLGGLTVATATHPGGVAHGLFAHGGLLLAVWYLLTFGLAPFYGFSYWLRDRPTSLVRAIALAHLYTLYSYLWFPAGWAAVWRIATRRRGWAKTTRTVDATPAAVDR
jgi:cellulose synthase/poly-beta-1,6-N-acetylglucosamine synthase-like glycosyltransferase